MSEPNAASPAIGVLPIVQVYLGNRLPVYARLNLRYLRRTFPEHDVWLVSDNDRTLNVAARLGARTYRCEDPNAVWAGVRDSLPYRQDFRKGFWFLTMARFIALAEFAEMLGNNGFLHVESDVWLSPDFPFDEVAGPGTDFAYPLERAEGGVASTLYCAGKLAMEKFVREAEAMAPSGALVSDMSFLAHLVDSASLSVAVLPTALRASDLLDPAVDETTRARMTGTGQQFTGVFDGMAWGVDILGEDPRNAWGLLRLFRKHRAGVIDTTRAQVSLGANGTLQIVLDDGSRAPLYSLHVHSKDVLLFAWPNWRLARRLRQRAVGATRVVWLPWVAIRVLWSLGVPWLRRMLSRKR